jgi:hypothetical protein
MTRVEVNLFIVCCIAYIVLALITDGTDSCNLIVHVVDVMRILARAAIMGMSTYMLLLLY